MQIQFRTLTPMLIFHTFLLTATCFKEGVSQNASCVYANVHVYDITYFIMEKHTTRWHDAEQTCVEYGMEMAIVVNDFIPKVEAVIKRNGLNMTFRTWIKYTKDSSQNITYGVLICEKNVSCHISTDISANKNDGNSNTNDDHKLQETEPHVIICEINSNTIKDGNRYKNLSLSWLDPESQCINTNCLRFLSTDINNPITESSSDSNIQSISVQSTAEYSEIITCTEISVHEGNWTRRTDNGLQLCGQSNNLETLQKEHSSRVSGTQDGGEGNSVMHVGVYNRAYDTFRPNDDFRYIYQEPELGLESDDASEVMNFSTMVDLDIANDVTESPKRTSLKVEDHYEKLNRSQDHVYATVVKTKL
ncbi:hypothetical protein ACJMK2_010985 [Sinanodonta woodiana]|uniref:C-type lectin domain-containing protein n=1 Tax=Sinanodonta woodiana TaxID=1069815 RepID=A0ABD3V5X2_SINWO